MSLSLDVYPRRVVVLPEGDHALIVVRRNVEPKFNFFNAWDLRWELAHLWRLTRRDRRWRVELYRGVSVDPQATPRQDPDQTWILADLQAAATFAETLSGHLGRFGEADSLRSPRTV